VRSKANTSQLNLPHGNRQLKSAKTEKLKSTKQMCSEITVNSLGNPCSESRRRKKEEQRWEGFAEKEGFKPRMKKVSGCWNTK